MMWCVVCGAELQRGQVSGVSVCILFLYAMRALWCPHLSLLRWTWSSLLRVASEASTSGGISPSTVFGPSSCIALVASVLCMCVFIIDRPGPRFLPGPGPGLVFFTGTGTG